MAVDILCEIIPSMKYLLMHFKLMNGDARGLSYYAWKMLGAPYHSLLYQVYDTPGDWLGINIWIDTRRCVPLWVDVLRDGCIWQLTL